ncbi:MAG TPA: glucodextranase DOMON-like domain-containing protein [Gaiellaceae bacterium]|nr:glucodextranase DOMON-like domain-containing protein [Gaiellaceae bacterium]
MLAVAAAALALLPASTVAQTPNPTSVTIAGSLQSELGCPGDWQADCAMTHLAYDAGDDVWQGTFSLPAGSSEYKAALNDSWDENYGLNAQPNGANIPLALPATANVKFYYDHKSHWVTDDRNSVIAVAPGSFQSELGCPGDWDPSCLRSWLQDPDGNGIYSFETTALPAGSYEAKVAINESWDENYGAGGVPNGPNITFTVPVSNLKVTFTYDAASHVLTIDVASPEGAPDGPGMLSHFGLARKDCVGTARNTTSKVWYTIADGVLSDVYYPTVDNTNVETLQYVVTDGSTFTDLQVRDMTYTVETERDSGGMACTVVATATSGKYRIETDYVTDPARNSVLMHVRFKPDVAGLRLYARIDPTVNGNGGGGAGNGGADRATIDDSAGHPVLVSFDPVTETNAANRDYAQPVYAALDGPFTEATSGFVGAGSDGLVQLDAAHELTTTYVDALGGNVAQTARVELKGGVPGGGKATLALGFGATQEEAVATAAGSLAAGFPRTQAAYVEGWRRYDRTLAKPRTHRLPGIQGPDANRLEDAYYVSANVIKASEDKTFPGAIVASLASPWGQAVSAGDPANTYFGSYREVFARDLYESWTGLVAAGDLATARDATLFLFERQQLPDGSMPRNSLVNGKVAPDSFGVQLDETAYPILMAYQLGLTDPSLYANHIKRAANFVASRGPAFGVERWEEQSGFSPSTIASAIAGLVAAAELAEANGDTASAAVWLGVADSWQRQVKDWTVTTTGPLAPRYFIRLSKTGDPNAAISYNVGNGGPTLDQREVIDAGFLELVRLGLLPVDDPDVAASLPVVDATIKSTTSRGPGWHRYNGDGYGDRASDGRPWAPSGQGTGHLWPALSAERAEHHLVSGDPAGAAALLQGMSRFTSGVGLVPEQNWELPDLARSPHGTDPTLASIGFENGGAAGSASPLTWSAASFVRLTGDLAAGRNVVLPAATHARYVAASQGETTLTVTAPADNSSVGGSPVTVTGTTAPGNTVYVSATNTDTGSETATASTTAPTGSFSVDVAVTGGTNVLNVVAVSPSGATAHVKRTVLFDFVPGTLLLDVADPDGDDDGPGNYAYPTFAGFQPGAFDIQRFQVYDSGSDVTFRLQTRNLAETFGSPLGAQLVDVYVRVPGAATTSTEAAHPLRNFTIAPSFAWSRLIQVQGFGQRYVDAGGATVGTATISANPISRFITFSVSKATLGTPGPGWGFTVVLTGQDGFSPDQARGFAPTPQEFQFGVCATPSMDPHCTFDPGLVPKAVDVLAGAANQATMLDYTLGPVVLTGVELP